jgi:hypothetical protein
MLISLFENRDAQRIFDFELKRDQSSCAMEALGINGIGRP